MGHGHGHAPHAPHAHVRPKIPKAQRSRHKIRIKGSGDPQQRSTHSRTHSVVAPTPCSVRMFMVNSGQVMIQTTSM